MNHINFPDPREWANPAFSDASHLPYSSLCLYFFSFFSTAISSFGRHLAVIMSLYSAFLSFWNAYSSSVAFFRPGKICEAGRWKVRPASGIDVGCDGSQLLSFLSFKYESCPNLILVWFAMRKAPF